MQQYTIIYVTIQPMSLLQSPPQPMSLLQSPIQPEVSHVSLLVYELPVCPDATMDVVPEFLVFLDTTTEVVPEISVCFEANPNLSVLCVSVLPDWPWWTPVPPDLLAPDLEQGSLAPPWLSSALPAPPWWSSTMP